MTDRQPRRARFRLVAVAVFVAFACVSVAMAQGRREPQRGLSHQILTITSQHTGQKFVIDAEVARTPEQIMTGMMYRKDVPVAMGMLFLVDPPKPVSFWMENTFVSLDMLFARKDGTIITIAPNAKPHDLTPVPSGGEVSFVLEIKGGEAQRLGIKVGDKLQ